MRIAVIFGTRPEAIKLAPVIEDLRQSGCFDVRVWVTGQHRELLDQVLTAFEIEPDADLRVMQPDQDLTNLTARILAGLDRLLLEEKPDLVLVQGDSTTTFAASLAAFYAKVPVGHVEAGLRTGWMSEPWPEEMNRVLTSRLADFHFVATESARDNLLREGVEPARIHITGNTVIDALHGMLRKIGNDPILRRRLEERFSFLDSSRRLVVITTHRREHFGSQLHSVLRAVVTTLSSWPHVEVVYSVHPNPNVRTLVRKVLGTVSRSVASRLHLIESLDYASFIHLLTRCSIILTDSGGVQEEAPVLGKPVLLLREKTERGEGLERGTMRLVGRDEATIATQLNSLLSDDTAYEAMSQTHSPFGDGHASERITAILREESRAPRDSRAGNAPAPAKQGTDSREPIGPEVRIVISRNDLVT